MINQFRQFFQGIKTYFNSIPFLFEKRLGYFLIVPGIIWILFFYSTYKISSYGGFALSSWLQNKIYSLIPQSNKELEGIMSVIQWIIELSVKIILWWTLSSMIKYIVLIFLSPVLALLSEKTDEIISGNRYPFSIRQFLKDVARGIRLALRNMIIEYSLILAGGLITLFVPFSFIVVTPFLLLLSWYFSGLSFVDYSLERHGFSIRESIAYGRANKGWIIGIGCCFSLLIAFDNPFSFFSSAWIIFLIFKIVFGLILFSFTPILASIASTKIFLSNKNVSKA